MKWFRALSLPLVLFSFIVFLVPARVSSALDQSIEHKLGIDVDVEEFWSISHPVKLMAYGFSVKKGDRVTVTELEGNKVLVTHVPSGKKVIIDVGIAPTQMR